MNKRSRNDVSGIIIQLTPVAIKSCNVIISKGLKLDCSCLERFDTNAQCYLLNPKYSDLHVLALHMWAYYTY